MRRYLKWNMTGEHETRFGKTPLAWQRALKGKFGLQTLSIPSRIIVDRKNPWSPFVHVDPSMAGIFFMDAIHHLIAIGARR